ncbi:hypothetical protein ACJ5NV_09325 [Loktanella agnita]|uniref:hypothetical protein n=1 Tax=Loktanella agnita TaxID=287097 RepID=UPI003985AAA0
MAACESEQILSFFSDALPDLHVGKRRMEVEAVLSAMAVEIIQTSGSEEIGCRIKADAEFPIGAPYGQDIAMPIRISALIRESSVCLNHNSFENGGRPNYESQDAYIARPFLLSGNSEQQQRTFLPVCFDTNGTILGYLDYDI